MCVAMVGQRFLLLHVFTKKTQQTAPSESTWQSGGITTTSAGRRSSMDDLDSYVERRKARDPEFRQARDEGQAQADFRHAVIAARLAAGLSQKELATRLDTSQAAIARLEAGTYRPRIETLLKLAVALKVTFEVDGDGVHVRQAA